MSKGVFVMRSLWKGSISFGLVNIPVKLYAATRKKTVQFRQLHDKCLTPLEYKRFCPRCRKEAAYGEIVKGYEYDRDRFVIIKEEDLAKIPDKTTKTIDIVDFIDLSEIDPLYYNHAYYLTPTEMGEKAYNLLQESMRETGKIAVARLTIRSKHSLAALRTYEDILSLETMFYPDEVRDTAELPSWNRGIEIHEHELKMARELIENLTAPFDPGKYIDEYRKALLEIIEAKVAGEEVAIVEPVEGGRVTDLVEALQASLEVTAREEKKDDRKEPTGAGRA